jgi:predicted ATPase/class 3 adenylate cyclase
MQSGSRKDARWLVKLGIRTSTDRAASSLEMSELPSGTVTFLFTDIEGSTRLLHELGTEGYAHALAEHRARLREAFGHHGGVEVDTQGDAFFVAFPTAPGALAAAAEAQASLAAGPIEVRMALHTGTPLVTEDGYVGADVHRAARIAAAGHGAQVLISATTASLIKENGLRDLGEHRFKDLAAAERIYQLGEAEFPPLRSLYQTNLPVPATPFLGRVGELAEVTDLLLREDIRVLTLTGSGGTGKTRLALQAAAASAEVYRDGLTWVPLSALRDPSLTLTAVAQALEVKEESGRALGDTLAEKLAGTHALFVLDNAEHLLPAIAGELARLRDTDGPTLLVTSRERLGLEGEHVWPVPPLDESDGVALFAERARSLDPSFTSTAEVDQLCAGLDNLPLALELAAARTSLFTPAQLLDRLAQRLDLLKGGREAEPRHATLRATIAWSYDLLDADEQRLFRRLSAFPAGCSYEVAERVCGAKPDTLQSLIDKSLVRRRETEDGPRYWMLETIREFAVELLEECGEATTTRERVIKAAVDFAVAAEPGWRTADVATWLRRFRLELDNLRQAIRWALEIEGDQRALAICAYLSWLWQAAGLLREGFESTQLALSHAHKMDPGLEGYGRLTLGILAAEQGQRQAAVEFLRSSLPLIAQAHPHDHAYALFTLGDLLSMHDSGEAQALLRQAEKEARALDDPMLVGAALEGLSAHATRIGNRGAARALLEEALALVDEPYQRTVWLLGLATIEFLDGATERARELVQEARSLAEGLEMPRESMFIHVKSAYIELVSGNAKEAELDLASARKVVDASGASRVLAALLLGEAALHVRRGESETAIKTWSQAESLVQELGHEWDPDERLLIQQLLEPLRSLRSKEEFQRCWSAGQTASTDSVWS